MMRKPNRWQESLATAYHGFPTHVVGVSSLQGDRRAEKIIAMCSSFPQFTKADSPSANSVDMRRRGFLSLAGMVGAFGLPGIASASPRRLVDAPIVTSSSAAFSKAERAPLTTVIRVIGVGSVGVRTYDYIIRNSVQVEELACIEANSRALERCRLPTKRKLGPRIGNGEISDVGKLFSAADRVQISKALSGAELAIIIASTGGSVVRFANSTIAAVARDLGFFSVAIVTKPCFHEGNRISPADQGLAGFARSADAHMVIDLEEADQSIGSGRPVLNTFRGADNAITIAVEAFAEFFALPRLVDVDLNDIRDLLNGPGRVVLGAGAAYGVARSRLAATQAITACSKKASADISTASVLWINIDANDRVGLRDYREVLATIKELASPSASVVVGMGHSNRLEGQVRVSVAAFWNV